MIPKLVVWFVFISIAFMFPSKIFSHSEGLFIPSDTGEALDVFGTPMKFKVSPDNTKGAFAVKIENTPLGKGPPLHKHRNEFEFFLLG